MQTMPCVNNRLMGSLKATNPMSMIFVQRRVDEVQDRVLDAADVLVYWNPVGDLPVKWGFVVVRIAVPKVVPR
jgi:hypothetical protein